MHFKIGNIRHILGKLWVHVLCLMEVWYYLYKSVCNLFLGQYPSTLSSNSKGSSLCVSDWILYYEGGGGDCMYVEIEENYHKTKLTTSKCQLQFSLNFGFITMNEWINSLFNYIICFYNLRYNSYKIIIY